jgi:hypothetical protein
MLSRRRRKTQEKFSLILKHIRDSFTFFRFVLHMILKLLIFFLNRNISNSHKMTEHCSQITGNLREKFLLSDGSQNFKKHFVQRNF